MKKTPVKILLASAAAAAALSASAVKIGVETVGTTFKVSVTEDDGKTLLTNGTVKATLDNFGPEIITPEAAFDLAKKNPFNVSGVLKKPGCLRIRLTSDDIPGFEKTHNMAGCYCNSILRGQIRPAKGCPDDFMDFWQDAIAKYNREIPAEPVLKLDESLCDGKWNVWRLTLDVPNGRKLHCFVTKEKSAPAGRLPGRVQIAAAGYGGWSQQPVMIPGHVTLMITVYPFEPDVKLGRKADYDAGDAAAKAKWGVPRYCHGGISDSRENYFFYPVILGANRAIDWFAARDDIDPARLTYQGTSQGGGLGFAVTALNRHIRRSALFVPALTGLYGLDAGYESGWPKIIENHPEAAREAVRKNAIYFDGASFAPWIKVPVRVAIGLADTTCPPPAVMSAYNSLNYTYYKDATIVPGMTHGCHGYVYDEFLKWLDDIPDTVALWPEGKMPRFRSFQSVPEIEFYAPTGTATKACIIVAPGGGYEGLAYAHEGLRTARNFLDLGLHVAILRYRTPHDSPDYEDGEKMCQGAWMDAQRAIRIVRSQAKARGYDENKIGMTGFSAGGHLVCKAATCSETPAYEPIDEIDKIPCNLDFAAPVYPAYILKYPGDTWKNGRGAEVDNPLAGGLTIDAKTPPMCFIHGDIDCHSAMGSVKLYTELRRRKISAELHVYAGVHHGFGGSVRHQGTQSGWEILVRNFLTSQRMAPYYDAFNW